MPEILGIVVPQSLFDTLVREEAVMHVKEVLNHSPDLPNKADIITKLDAFYQADKDSDEYIQDCLVALIRMHSNDYKSPYSDIEMSEEYFAILREVERHSEKLAHELFLTDSVLQQAAVDYVRSVTGNPQAIHFSDYAER